MSIHNLRYSVQLIKIATRNKTNLGKITIFWRWNQLCARHSYVCRHGLYVVYIVTQTRSFPRSRDLDKSNTFGQMQELTNDYYSEIKLHNILHIEYKAIELSTNKKEPTISFPIAILERQRGSHWSWPPMADSYIRRIAWDARSVIVSAVTSHARDRWFAPADGFVIFKKQNYVISFS